MPQLIPDFIYDPNILSPISSRTKLAKGITLAKFLGAYGDKMSFYNIANEQARVQIARNLTLHARAITLINGNTDRFNDIRLIVSEGLYDRNIPDLSNETMKQKALGNLVYYQVIGDNGTIDLERTYDVAKFWSQHLEFDELILDYDEYNPDGSLTSQIGLLMPNVPTNYNVIYKSQGQNETFNDNSLLTVFNGTIQQIGALVEFTDKNIIKPVAPSKAK